MKKRQVKKIFNNFGIVVSIVIIITAALYLYTIFRSKTIQEVLFDYQVNSNINYKVNLTENEFIKDKYLPMDQVYITKLVDNISTTFNFEYTNEKIDQSQYYYEIKGLLVGSYRGDQSSTEKNDVWFEEELFKSSELIVAKNTFSINEIITVKPGDLLNRANSFQEKLGIAINSEYKLELNVYLTIGEDNIKKIHHETISFPVTNNIFKINKNLSSKDKYLVSAQKEEIEIERLPLIISVLALGLSILLLIKLIKMRTDKKSNYEKEVTQIFKSYGERIIMVENIAITPETKFISIVGFDELVELVNELNLPILCYQKEGINISWFFVIHDKIIYRYILE